MHCECAEPLIVSCWCTVRYAGKRAAPVHLAYCILAQSHGLYCAITMKSVKASKSVAPAAESLIGVFTLELTKLLNISAFRLQYLRT